MDQALAVNEIKASLALAGARLSSVSAPFARLAVPAAGLPAAAPKLGAPPGTKGVPVSDPVAVPARNLDPRSVPAARPLAREAAPTAEAAPIVALALAKFEAVPTR